MVSQAPDSVAAVRLNAAADAVKVVHQFGYWVVVNAHAHTRGFDMDLNPLHMSSHGELSMTSLIFSQEYGSCPIKRDLFTAAYSRVQVKEPGYEATLHTD